MTLTPFNKRQEMLLVFFLLGMTFSNAFMAVKLLPLLREGYQDFTIYYCAGRMARSGQSHSLYDLSAQYRVQREFAPKVSIRQAALPYNHPPFEALFFVPFTFLRYWPAYVLWSLLNFILLAVSLILLRCHFSQLAVIPPIIFGLSALSFFPVIMGIVQGQDVIFFLFLFVLTMIFLDKGKDAIAGAVLGAGLFRLQLAVPMLILLAFRRWRILAGLAPVSVILAGVSVAMTGWRGPYNYVLFVLHLEGSGARGYGSEAAPNLRGLVENFSGMGPSGTSTLMIVWFSLAVFVAAEARIVRYCDSILFSTSVAAVAAILVSFHSLVYDLSLLLPLVLFLLSRTLVRREEQNGIPTRLLIFALLCSPLYMFLWLKVGRFFWFSLILAAVFLKMMQVRVSERMTGSD